MCFGDSIKKKDGERGSGGGDQYAKPRKRTHH